ncbi:hypothetical protein CR513_16506, partial [Mucuna pruriens]
MLAKISSKIKKKILSNEATIARLLHEEASSLKEDPPQWFYQLKGKEKEKERPREDKSPKKESSPSQGQKEEHIPPCLGSLFKSSSINCFKCLGKGHIVS